MDIDDFCDSILPSGSGFNCDWNWLKTQKNGSEVFETFFHNMSEHGYYDGFTKIRLTIPAKLSDFRLTLSGPARYTGYDMREYLCDIIWHCLEGRAFTLSKGATDHD